MRNKSLLGQTTQRNGSTNNENIFTLFFKMLSDTEFYN